MTGLNRRQAVKQAENSDLCYAVLRLHGIPVYVERRQSAERPVRKYRVAVFQQSVIGVLKTDEKTVWLDRQIATDDAVDAVDVTDLREEAEIKRVNDCAIRSVYALGLDFGVVVVAAMSEFRVKAVGVDGSESAMQPFQAAFEQAYQAYEADQIVASIKQQEVLIGADPEFALRDQAGKMEIASRFVTRNGVIGYDTARLRENLTAVLHPLVELRPKPSVEPIDVYADMYRTLKRAAEKIFATDLQWIAGGMPFTGYPIGGHIHFSGVPLTFSLIRKLDAYLCLPLCMLEDEGCRKRRPRYGFLGDFRQKDHGGFEYRTLPSWLVTPQITKAVLILAKLVVTCQHQFTQDPLISVDVQKAYYQGDKLSLQPVVNRLYQELAALPMYRQYRFYLDPFFYDCLHGNQWPADTDIRLTWKLIDAMNTTPDYLQLAHTL